MSKGYVSLGKLTTWVIFTNFAYFKVLGSLLRVIVNTSRRYLDIIKVPIQKFRGIADL